jgi:hypothetical protein
MEDAAAMGVKVNELKIADWVWVERRQKIRAERRVGFNARVRGAFVLLFFAAIFVFIFNHQVEVQIAASAGLHQAAKQITVSDKLRQQALKHEKEVDKINE